jgi:hypothetical protein
MSVDWWSASFIDAPKREEIARFERYASPSPTRRGVVIVNREMGTDCSARRLLKVRCYLCGVYGTVPKALVHDDSTGCLCGRYPNQTSR